MNSLHRPSQATQAAGNAALVVPNKCAAVAAYFASLENWASDALPLIEEGLSRADADPIELVLAFQPWFLAAQEEVAPNLSMTTPEQAQEMISLFGRTLDVIERAYTRAGLPRSMGLGYLSGLDDLLIALSFVSRRSPSLAAAR